MSSSTTPASPTARDGSRWACAAPPYTIYITYNSIYIVTIYGWQVPMIAAKITQEEKDSTRATVDEDRKHAIEAAIVRIMKTRKTLDHQKLVLEASNQLLRHFKPDPKQIKKRIEDLIAREYLESDSTNNNVYKYLA